LGKTIKNKKIIFISGISGAGKSTAINCIKDLGFYTIENLPLNLIIEFIESSEFKKVKYNNLAISFESIEAPEAFKLLNSNINTKDIIFPIFLDSNSQTILKRYSETRRPHPFFNPDIDSKIIDSIKREREYLSVLNENSSLIINTNDLNVHQLKSKIKKFTGEVLEVNLKKMKINISSFGFKYGTPRDCNLIVDVRFLKNPYFNEDLRLLTGKDQKIKEYIETDLRVNTFYNSYLDMLNFLIPEYASEGKAYLNIGIGCTGGKHRSVYLVEKIYSALSKKFKISIEHRDINL